MKLSKFIFLFIAAVVCLALRSLLFADENPGTVAAPNAPLLLGELKGAGNIEISPDGKWLFAEGFVSNDGFSWRSIVRLWNLQDGSAQDVNINGGDLTWTRDNRLLDTGLRYGGKLNELSSAFARICSPHHVGQWQQFGDDLFTKDEYTVQQANVSPDGTEFWLLTRTKFRRFRVSDSRLITRITWGDSRTKSSAGSDNRASISSDGKEILQGEQKINFYSTKTGKRLRQLLYIFRPTHIKFRNKGEFEEWLPVTDWKNTPRITSEANSSTYNDNLSNRAIRDTRSGKILRRELAISNDAARPTVQNQRDKFYLEYDKIWRIPR